MTFVGPFGWCIDKHHHKMCLQKNKSLWNIVDWLQPVSSESWFCVKFCFPLDHLTCWSCVCSPTVSLHVICCNFTACEWTRHLQFAWRTNTFGMIRSDTQCPLSTDFCHVRAFPSTGWPSLWPWRFWHLWSNWHDCVSTTNLTTNARLMWCVSLSSRTVRWRLHTTWHSLDLDVWDWVKISTKECVSSCATSAEFKNMSTDPQKQSLVDSPRKGSVIRFATS